MLRSSLRESRKRMIGLMKRTYESTESVPASKGIGDGNVLV